MTWEHYHLLKYSFFLASERAAFPKRSRHCRLRRGEEACRHSHTTLTTWSHNKLSVTETGRYQELIGGLFQCQSLALSSAGLLEIPSISDSPGRAEGWPRPAPGLAQWCDSDVELKLIHFQKVRHCWSVPAAGAQPLAQSYITLRTWSFWDLASERGTVRKYLTQHASFTFYGSILSSRLPNCFFSVTAIGLAAIIQPRRHLHAPLVLCVKGHCESFFLNLFSVGHRSFPSGHWLAVGL